MRKISEHERIARCLESIREQMYEEMHEQEAAATYHAQHAAELDQIARRMEYSADQQRIFRISGSIRHASQLSARAMLARRQQGRLITKALTKMAAKANAANRQGSAA